MTSSVKRVVRKDNDVARIFVKILQIHLYNEIEEFTGSEIHRTLSSRFIFLFVGTTTFVLI